MSNSDTVTRIQGSIGPTVIIKVNGMSPKEADEDLLTKAFDGLGIPWTKDGKNGTLNLEKFYKDWVNWDFIWDPESGQPIIYFDEVVFSIVQKIGDNSRKLHEKFIIDNGIRKPINGHDGTFVEKISYNESPYKAIANKIADLFVGIDKCILPGSFDFSTSDHVLTEPVNSLELPGFLIVKRQDICECVFTDQIDRTVPECFEVKQPDGSTVIYGWKT